MLFISKVNIYKIHMQKILSSGNKGLCLSSKKSNNKFSLNIFLMQI